MTQPRTLDELSIALGRLRTSAGTPSYAEIARRIGIAHGGAEPPKVTVYDCFRPGRRRVDDRLVGEIVLALGESGTEAARWRELARTLNGERTGVHLEVTLAPRGATENIVGREDLVRELSGAEVVVLSGLPGVGKTTLATALLGDVPALTVQLRESEPGRPAAGPVDILRRMLGALGHRSLPYDLGRLRERFAIDAHGIPVVIEDAASPSRLAAILVPGIRFIITSRIDLAELTHYPSLAGRRVVQVTVPPLSENASRALLTRLVGNTGTASTSSDEPSLPKADALGRIVTVAGGLPLDLVMLAGVVREHAGWTLDDLASRFENEPRDNRIRRVLEAAGAALDDEDAATLADAALIDRDVDVDIVLEAFGPGTARSLERLRARHLVDLRDSRLQMHATVFAFARDRAMTLRPTSLRRAAVDRLAQVVLDRIVVDEDYAAREAGTVLAIAAAAHEHGLDTQGERLALAAHPALARWSMWSESLRLHDLAARARGLELIPEIALGVAHCAEKLGRYDEALLVLHRVRRVATGTAAARTWNQIGNVQHWMSHFEEALESYHRALDLAREAGDGVVEGRALGNHGNALRVLTRFDEAEREFSDALDIAVGAEDELNIGIVRANRALMWISTGRLDDAEEELLSILEEARGRSLPYVRMSLGLVAEARGDFAAARARYAQAVTVSDDSGEYSTSADLALLGARLDARAGRFTEAMNAARSALNEAERAGAPLIATESGNSLAEVIVAGVTSNALPVNLLEEAQRLALEAAGTAEAVGDRAEIARGYATCGRIAAMRGDAVSAEALAARSVSLYREIGHRLGAS